KSQLAGNAPGSNAFAGAGEIRNGRLPGGERFLATIEPMHGNQAVIYTSPEARSDNRLWRRHVLVTDLVDGHAVACVDFTKAGSDQLVVGWRAMGKSDVRVGIRLYAPADSEGREWKQMVVDDNGMACEDVAVADLDNDGRLDIIAAGRATKNVKIYWNQ